MLARAFTERTPENGNALIEAVLLDDNSSPDRCHQGRFVKQFPSVLDEIEQHIEYTRRQRHWICGGVGEQQPMVRIEPKPAELVQRSRPRLCHLNTSEEIRTFQGTAKDYPESNCDSTRRVSSETRERGR
jgi:hypothetical protein